MDALKSLIKKQKANLKNKKYTIVREDKEEKRQEEIIKKEESLKKVKLEKRELSKSVIQHIRNDIKEKASEFKVFLLIALIFYS